MSEPQPLPTPWMTITQAGQYVHKSPRFLRREIRNGRLRAARIGGRGEVLTRREWLDEFVEALMTPVPVLVSRRGLR